MARSIRAGLELATGEQVLVMDTVLSMILKRYLRCSTSLKSTTL